jgi:uncharacterized membrane protein YqgA involved in biofilm formation
VRDPVHRDRRAGRQRVNIEKRLDQLGGLAEKKFFGRAKAAASPRRLSPPPWCTAWAQWPSSAAMDSGLRGNHATLIASPRWTAFRRSSFCQRHGDRRRAVRAGGPGVSGMIALLSTWIAPLLTDAIINEMSAVGGLLIVGIGLNMIYDKHISVGNLLPAIFVPMAYLPIVALF